MVLTIIPANKHFKIVIVRLDRTIQSRKLSGLKKLGPLFES
ncbi:MAG: hypothetical protein RDU01_06285 [Thermodesulfovibrionales bacterium]|nr:hypothetical protein [Thermodesulfovibrionales bacterium]